MTVRSVTADQLWDWLHDGGEIVVADIRDGGPFSRGHILAAASIPLAQIEVLAPVMVPRKSTRTVLVDDDGTLAARAADLLVSHGYGDVWCLEGGQSSWEASGRQVFSGSGIISKAFGEMVEHRLDTPRIEAADLREWQESGRDFVLVDARPLAEFRTVSLPGGVDCPGAELVYRVPGIVQSPATPVVVNCAGRTRSIIGAQSLRDAGITNPVFALKNGTMGWQLAGFGVASGVSDMVPEPSADALETARELAGAVCERSGLSVIDRGSLLRFAADASRTTYVFDVRQADAFERGHLPGAVHAPGGQLVQATDSYAAVRNARIVVVDEHMVQSVMTAHWLARMGWEVHVLAGAAPHFTETGPQRRTSLTDDADRVPSVTVDQVAGWVTEGSCVVVDVGESYWYREGRIPGSYYSMRSRLRSSLSRFRHDDRIVVCCSDGRLAPFAAADARRLGFDRVHWLEGGRGAWRRAGHAVERIGEDTDELVLSETDDMWYPPWARKEGVDEAIMQYLTWETGLLEPVSRETYIKFELP